MEFKYKSRFSFPIHTVYAKAQGDYVATASLQNLLGLVPDKARVEENFDLLYNAFNAAVINRINKNDDGIDSQTAVAIYKNFINKFQDIEHSRLQIVGHIIASGFSEFKTNILMTEEQAKSSSDPYYLNLGAVVYRLVNPELCDLLIESADETSPRFNTISCSWELGFNDYQILLGHKDFKEGELVTDSKQIEAFSKYLRMYGGQGHLDDGTNVYRIIKGQVLPLGCGYTTAPAAEVEGVIIMNPNEEKDEQKTDATLQQNREVIEVSRQNEETDAQIEEKNKEESNSSENNTQNNNKIEENEKKSSQVEINAVKISSIMKLEDITEDNLKNLSAANVRQFIADEIEKASKQYGEQLDSVKKEKETFETQSKEIQANLDKMTEDLEKVKQELEKERDERNAEKAQADFNTRMSDLNDKFNLSDKDKAAVAKRIKGMNDEEYEDWFSNEFSVLAEQKNKQFKQEDKKEETSASVEDLLDAAKKKEGQNTPPNNSDVNNRKSEWAEAFKLEDIVNLPKLAA